MRRKLFNASQLRRIAAVGALLLAGRAAHAQEATQARMWAAAARYVYADDPNLKPLLPKLNAALGEPQTLGQFEQKLLAASDEVAKASKTPNVRVLQRQFGNMRTMNALQLYKNLPDSLAKMPARTSGERKQKLAALGTTLMALAQNNQIAAPPPADAAPAETTAAPGATLAAPPAAPATSPWVWGALAMSGLSLLGVIRLMGRPAHSSGSAGSSGSGQPRQPSRELSPEQHQEVKRLIEAALASQAGSPTPAAQPAVRPTPPANPMQSTKQKLANATKTTRPPVEAPAAAPLPPLASLATAAVAAPPALPEGALVSGVFTVPVAPVLEAISAVVEPGTSVELDPTPAPAPMQRLQFVNEAPFNNAFAARTLSDSPATYSIYEIVSTEQTPDLGQFRVVGNLVSHISNHRNILEPVCAYVAYPQGGETRIVTEQAGEVRRRGADWEIVRPARIRFE